MRVNKMAFSAALVLGLLTAGLARSANANPEEDKLAVEGAINEFYASLNALFNGETLPMEQIWSHADDVTYMGPIGGFQTGWPQVWELWQAQARLNLGGSVLPTEVHITVGNDLAFVENYELGANNASNGDPIEVAIRATSLLRKEDGQWKIIGHHTDILPGLEKNERVRQDDDPADLEEPVVSDDDSK